MCPDDAVLPAGFRRRAGGFPQDTDSQVKRNCLAIRQVVMGLPFGIAGDACSASRSRSRLSRNSPATSRIG